MLRIALDEGARDDLRVLRAFERAHVLEAIARHLAPAPDRESRRCKRLREPVSPFDRVLWEFRVGNVRVFYEVDAVLEAVVVLAIRCKPDHWTTQRTLAAPAADTVPGRAHAA
jgi:mRNA-degrading endonuclease RelE of RelBE toxin-antitoxin system